MPAYFRFGREIVSSQINIIQQQRVRYFDCTSKKKEIVEKMHLL